MEHVELAYRISSHRSQTRAETRRSKVSGQNFGIVMDSIYHEKQEGQLCAQHCLNNLLQGPYFTAVELADFARDLDDDERMRMAEGGLDSPQYLRFLKQPSSNMDDSGYFSMQVISRALEVWLLSMVPLTSPSKKDVLTNPVDQKAFICNHDSHWLTIRKLGLQWFDLNSLHSGPELISDTYLSLFLTQLQMEGYTIFVIEGDLPPCEADQLLTLVPIQTDKHTSKKNPPQSGGHHSKSAAGPSREKRRSNSSDDEFAFELAAALSASMTTHTKVKDQEEFDITMASALSESMRDQVQSTEREEHRDLHQQQAEGGGQGEELEDQLNNSVPLSKEELRQKRLLHFQQPPKGDT